MQSDRWERAKLVFLEALDKSPADRESFALEACGSDGEVAAEVLRLLRVHGRARRSLSNPILPNALGRLRDAPPRFLPPFVAAGRFRILRLIAYGGIGEVYEAEDLQIGVRVALKTIRPEIAGDDQALELIRNEIQHARRVTHPNVCRIYDFAQHSEPRPQGAEATVFLTMELLSGETLADYLQRAGPFTPDQALPLIAQIVSALEAAHAAGVIHRDLKPGNVMLVSEADGRMRAVVTDFGLAMSREHARAGAPVSPVAGTPGYMSPEQIAGGEITTATDVYSLGLVIADMIGASVLAPGTSILRSLIHAIGAETRVSAPRATGRWKRVLARCLETDPRQRFSRPIEVLSALEEGNRQNRILSVPKLIAAACLLVATVALLLTPSRPLRRGPSSSRAAAFRRIGPEEGPITLWRPSPDGRYLALTDWTTGKIALRDLRTGETRTVAKHGAPADAGAVTAAFSPDGTRVAYAAQYAARPCELRIVDARIGQDSLLYSEPSTQDCEVFDWSRDGCRILARFYGHPAPGISVITVADRSAATAQIGDLESYGNVVFSPDGRQVVFSGHRPASDAETDIYMAPIGGGPATPLVAQPANHVVVGFASDDRLVFLSDRKGANGIWAVSIGGQRAAEPRELAPEIGRSEPLGITRDGSVYYLLATNTQDVYTAQIDFAAGRLLSPPESVVKRFSGSFLFPSWSPDGRNLAFWWRLDRDSIAVYARDTGRIRRVTPRLRQFRRPQWSPSGHGIFVLGNDHEGRTGIFRVDPVTGETALAISQPALGSGYEGAWSRDGRVIFDRFDNEKLGIFRMDVGTGRRRVLYVPPADVSLKSENLALSPDQRTLAFQALQPGSGASSLMVMPADGGPARPLLTVHKPEWFPFGSFAWTSDSRQVIAVRSRKEGSEIWLAPLDGRPPKQVDFPRMGIIQLRVNPDGRTIAFTSGAPSAEIWVAENLLPSGAR